MKIELRNDDKTATVRPRANRLSRRQVRRSQRTLGVRGWGSSLGHTNSDVVAQVLPDGSAEIYQRADLQTALVAEIDRRGGETGINHSPSQGCSASQTRFREVNITDVGISEGRLVVLLRAKGWRYYSRRFGARPASLAYLAGYDDNGPWAVRVPGTMDATEEAMDWIVPAVVQRARAAGRQVLRQGDVYAVQTNRAHEAATDEDIDTHRWYARSRVLVHADMDRPHAPMLIPFRCRFIQQRGYEMGRGAGMGAAD